MESQPVSSFSFGISLQFYVVACIYMDLICQTSSGSDHLWLHSEVGRNEGVGKSRLQGKIFGLFWRSELDIGQ